VKPCRHSTSDCINNLEGTGATTSAFLWTKESRAGAASIWAVVDSICNGTECPELEWIMLRRTYNHPFPINTSPEGELWIIVDTESGFEHVTGVYFRSITVNSTPP
jgi:hypothetical protein